MPGWLYILRLKSGQLYIGSTTDLDQQYKDHCLGKACRATSLDPPISLVYSEELETFSDARKREAQVKRWSRAKKEALVSGDLTKLKDLSKAKKIQYLELALREAEKWPRWRPSILALHACKTKSFFLILVSNSTGF